MSDHNHQRSQSRIEKLLLQASRSLNATVDYEELIKISLSLVCGALNCEAAFIYRVDEKINHRRVRLLQAGADNLQVLRKKPGSGISGWTLKHSEAAMLNDPEKDSRYDGELARQLEFPIKNLLANPLIARGRTFGVIEAINKKSGDFDSIDLDTLLGLSDQIALSIDNSQLIRQARREARERQKLFSVSTKLSGALHLEQALELIMDSVNELVGFDAGGIFLADRELGAFGKVYSRGYDLSRELDLHIKLSEGLIGWVAEHGESVIVPNVEEDDRYVSAREGTCSEMVAPVKLDGAVIGVFNLESDEVEAYDGHSAELLEAFGSQAAVVLERTKLHDEIVRSRAIERQLEIAHEIQREFLPASDPQFAGYDISGMNAAFGEVGGDYYGFIEISPTNIGIAIADVAGKGIPAALIMASFRASLIAEIRNDFSVSVICGKVNRLLHESVEPGDYVTGVYGSLDSDSNKFCYSNAGHNPPLMLRVDGSVEALDAGGAPFGIIAGGEYQEASVEFNSGDMLALYTDGVTEAENPSGEQFGEKRLEELLIRLREENSAEIRIRVFDAVRDFASGAKQSDDITLIIIKRL